MEQIQGTGGALVVKMRQLTFPQDIFVSVVSTAVYSFMGHLQAVKRNA